MQMAFFRALKIWTANFPHAIQTKINSQNRFGKVATQNTARIQIVKVPPSLQYRQYGYQKSLSTMWWVIWADQNFNCSFGWWDWWLMMTDAVSHHHLELSDVEREVETNIRVKFTHFPPLQLDFASAYAKEFSIPQEHSSILTFNYVRFCWTISSFLLFPLHPFNSSASWLHVLKTNRVTNSRFLFTGPAHSPHPLILGFFLNSFSFFNIRLGWG